MELYVNQFILVLIIQPYQTPGVSRTRSYNWSNRYISIYGQFIWLPYKEIYNLFITKKNINGLYSNGSYSNLSLWKYKLIFTRIVLIHVYLQIPAC